jgi:hypothetical protein
LANRRPAVPHCRACQILLATSSNAVSNLVIPC